MTLGSSAASAVFLPKAMAQRLFDVSSFFASECHCTMSDWPFSALFLVASLLEGLDLAG